MGLSRSRTVFRYCALLGLLVDAVGSCAQSFYLDQFDQLFRPRLRVEARWLPETAVRDDSATYEERNASAAFTFPIYSSAWAKDRIRDTTGTVNYADRSRPFQIMGTARWGVRRIAFEEVPGSPHDLYSAALGVSGLHMGRKFRLLFWRADVSINEEARTIERPVLRYGATLGRMHVYAPRKQFFYGIALTVSDKLALPWPFIGGTVPLGHHGAFQYLVPTQVSFVWRAAARTRINAGLGLAASRSGIEFNAYRTNINYSALRTFLQVRQVFGDRFFVRAEVSYALRQRLGLGTGTVNDDVPPILLEPGIACMLGINVLFGRSLLDQLLDEVVR